MAPSQQQTGLFFMGTTSQGALKEFPAKFNGSLTQQLDRPFIIILAICSLLVGGIFFLLSLKPLPDVISEKEILRIQERYAQLVLNQPKKKVQETVTKVETSVETKKKEEIKQEEKEEKIDRKNESIIDKTKRKEASKVERKQKREEIKKRVQASGIFAAITATGTGIGNNSGSVTDLLGTASNEIDDLGEIDISKGSFATKKVNPNELTERRGKKTSGISIEKEAVGKAEGTKIASSGSIAISTAPPEIKGESAGAGSRSQAAINKVVSLQQSRLKKVYEAMLKRDPKLGGKLIVKFTIMPNGTVADVSIVSSTTNNATFDSRILSYVKRWKFSPISGGGPVEVVFPFIFTGSS